MAVGDHRSRQDTLRRDIADDDDDHEDDDKGLFHPMGTSPPIEGARCLGATATYGRGAGCPMLAPCDSTMHSLRRARPRPSLLRTCMCTWGWLTCAKQRSRCGIRPPASLSHCVGFRGSLAKRPRKAPRLEPKQLLAIMGTVNILRPAKVARLFFLFVFHGLAVAVFAGFLTAYLPETPCTAMGPQTPTLENTSGATGPYAHTAQ